MMRGITYYVYGGPVILATKYTIALRTCVHVDFRVQDLREVETCTRTTRAHPRNTRVCSPQCTHTCTHDHTTHAGEGAASDLRGKKTQLLHGAQRLDTDHKPKPTQRSELRSQEPAKSSGPPQGG